jgi:site-specific DNA-cytosine methylase
MALHSIELFAGVGMLGEGLRAGLAHLGIPTRTVCFVEREAHAASVLVARMEEGSLDAVRCRAAPVARSKPLCTTSTRASLLL